MNLRVGLKLVLFSLMICILSCGATTRSTKKRIIKNIKEKRTVITHQGKEIIANKVIFYNAIGQVTKTRKEYIRSISLLDGIVNIDYEYQDENEILEHHSYNSERRGDFTMGIVKKIISKKDNRKIVNEYFIPNYMAEKNDPLTFYYSFLEGDDNETCYNEIDIKQVIPFDFEFAFEKVNSLEKKTVYYKEDDISYTLLYRHFIKYKQLLLSKVLVSQKEGGKTISRTFQVKNNKILCKGGVKSYDSKGLIVERRFDVFDGVAVFTYKYILNEYGDWIKRECFDEGRLNETIERIITYKN